MIALSTPYLFGAFAILYIGYRVALKVYTDARIRKLGARAPIRRSYFPYSLDFAYDAVVSAMNNRIYEMWMATFDRCGGPGRYTMEVGIGERVIMTADPENIKAILATQFKDFGKGEQFRLDWHDFLGNGT